MKYDRIREAIFVDRPNRFIAHVNLDGRLETVHVKNTGRCRELLWEGVKVILYDSNNPARKTRYDLVSVWKDNLGWVNIDSQAPNTLVKEWLSGDNGIFGNITYMKPEYKYGDSRIDFYIECQDKKLLMEVKGCTLEIDGKGYFPDAPTERGVKHLRELIKAGQNGFEPYLAFVIQMEKIDRVYPSETDPEFCRVLKEAEMAGVRILFLGCNVSEDEIRITGCKRNYK